MAEATECNYCFSEIDTRASVCKHCGRHQGLVGSFSQISIVSGVVLSIFAACISFYQSLAAREESLKASTAMTAAQAAESRVEELVSEVSVIAYRDQVDRAARLDKQISNCVKAGIVEPKCQGLLFQLFLELSVIGRSIEESPVYARTACLWVRHDLPNFWKLADDNQWEENRESLGIVDNFFNSYTVKCPEHIQRMRTIIETMGKTPGSDGLKKIFYK